MRRQLGRLYAGMFVNAFAVTGWFTDKDLDVLNDGKRSPDSSADGQCEEGIDRSFEWTGTSMYLGE